MLEIKSRMFMVSAKENTPKNQEENLVHDRYQDFQKRMAAHRDALEARSFGEAAFAICNAVRAVSYHPQAKQKLDDHVKRIADRVPPYAQRRAVGRMIIYQMALQELCVDDTIGQDVRDMLVIPVGGETQCNRIFSEPFQRPETSMTLGHWITRLIGSPAEKDEARKFMRYAKDVRQARQLKIG